MQRFSTLAGIVHVYAEVECICLSLRVCVCVFVCEGTYVILYMSIYPRPIYREDLSIRPPHEPHMCFCLNRERLHTATVWQGQSFGAYERKW